MHILTTSISALSLAGLIWVSGASSLSAAPIADVTNPGNPILAIDFDGDSGSPGAEGPANTIDDTLNKYLNFGEQNSGIIVTPSTNPLTHAVRSLTITTANDWEARDPSSFVLYGTDDSITSTDHGTGTAENWTLIAAGALSLPAARNTVGPTVEFPNDTHYQSFRLIFPTLKNPGSTNSMQLAELQLDANDIGSPQPAALPIPDVTNNGDSIIAIDFDGDSSSPGAEGPANAIDNTLDKCLNLGEQNSGIIVTPSINPLTHAVRSLTITTANDHDERDPSSFALYGTNDSITSTNDSTGTAENWTFIAAGALSLPAARNTVGATVEFPNNTHYESFRLIFPTVNNPGSADSMQLADLQLDANAIGSVQPAALSIPDVTNNGDSIIAIDLDGGSASPGAEGPANAIDNTLAKYLNQGGSNSGLIVTPSLNPDWYLVTSLTITTANDAEGRDPASFELYGTNDPITSTDHSTGTEENWSLIAAGALSLPSARNTVGPTVSFYNPNHYDSFRLIFPTLKDSGNPLMQIAEVQLGATPVPEPSTFLLSALGLLSLALVGRRRQKR